jgi:hypothetical protein
MKAKRDDLKRRKTTISDDEADDDVANSHSPAKPLRRAPPVGVCLSEDPRAALPFRINNNNASLALLSSGTKRPHHTIDLCSDEEDEDQDDVIFFDENSGASGSGGRFGFGSRTSGGRKSQSPSKASTVERSMPMPTLASESGNRIWGRQKVELTKQRSDRHLPNLSSGTTDYGPKTKVKRRG